MPPTPNQLISSSAVAIHALTNRGKQVLIGLAQDFVCTTHYNVSHERAVGTPLIVESVTHGIHATFQGSQLWLVRQAMSEFGLVPTKGELLNWTAFDLRLSALAGDMKGKTLLLIHRAVIEAVVRNVRTQSTLAYNWNGTAQIALEHNEIG